MIVCKHVERLPGPSDSSPPTDAASPESSFRLALDISGGQLVGVEPNRAQNGSLRSDLAARGLAVSGLILRDDDAPRPMFAAGAGGQDPLVRIIVPSLALASAVGAKALCVPVSWLRPEAGTRSEDHLASWLHALQTLRFSALHHAVEVALEIGPPGPLKSPTEARRFFDDVNSPFIGAAMSIQSDTPDESESDFIITLTHRLRWIRWVSSSARSGEPAGESSVHDLPADFGRLLDDVRFDGILVT